MKISVKEITMGALLTAMAIIIPIQFGFLKIVAGPFSATLASHVPMFLSMFINPVIALMVGVGSALGFLLTTPIVVAARAAMHIVVGVIGAYLIKRGMHYAWVFGITAPIHAILEALVVIPFGWTAYEILVVVGVGTALHHVVDAAISSVIVYLVNPRMKLNLAKK